MLAQQMRGIGQSTATERPSNGVHRSLANCNLGGGNLMCRSFANGAVFGDANPRHDSRAIF
jgi:hypothetical protein